MLKWKAAALPVSAVDISEKSRNHFEITATYENGSENVVLYHIAFPS